MQEPYDEIIIRMAGQLALSQNPGKAMKAWREKAGIGQAELARKMKISPSVLSDYENGRRKSPGSTFLKRFVNALVELDRREGRLLSSSPPANEEGAILSIGEYSDPIPAKRVVESLRCNILTGKEQLDRVLFGYTVLDSLRTIYALSGAEFYKIYGASTERVVVFTRVGLGRSPMVAVRVSPLKPRMVVVHGITEVDRLAIELAERERLILASTDSYTQEEVIATLRGLAE
ncbi:MAG: helix-turn-helix domain-containing protein [Conexivisphaerales archaeon]